MKLKILKRMVAAVCVATISTSCISPSVGAFKAPANARVDVVNSVNQLNGSLDSLNNMLDGMLEITRREEQKCSVNDYDRQIELVTVLSNLEESKRYANELNEVVVYDSELANNLRGKLYGLVTTQKLASREINPQLCHYLPKGYLDTSNAMRKGLENIKRMLKQNDDSGKPNGIEGLVAAMIKATKDEKEKYEEKKYDARAIELDMLLEDLQYVQDELLEEMRKLDDDIHDVNFENQVKKMLRDVMGSLNLTFNKCEGQDRYYLDFSELWSDKVLEMMDKLKEIKNKMEEHVKNKSSNLANLEKEFKAKKDEFYARWTKHTAFSKQIGKYGQFDPTYQDRQNAANWCQKAFITKNEQAMRQAIECCNKAINSMNKYESANKKAENANKKAENANKKVENANKKAEEVKKSSTELNKELNKLKTNVDGMIKSTEDKLQDCSERDYDRKVSLVTLLSNLEAAQRLLKEISGIAVNDPDFANHIKQMFVDIDDMLDIFVIETGPVTVEFNEEKVPDMIEKLENIKKMMKENANKKVENANKKVENANKKVENANKKVENANKKAENANKKAEEVKKSSTELNKELNKLKTNVDGMIKSTEDKLQDCSERDYDRKVSLVTLLSNLEAAQRLLKEISGIAVNDPDFANHIKQMFVDIDDMLDIFVIETGPVTVEFNEEKVPDMIEKLENIKKMMKENAKK